MCVGHIIRCIIWRVTVYSCAQDKLTSSRICFFVVLVSCFGQVTSNSSEKEP
jgi:hypothetical protein